MIKGKMRREEDVPEYDEMQLQEEWYYHTLEQFEGVEGHYYGIMDEIHDLAKLIETIGQTVMKEEKEFRSIEREESDVEGPYPTERVLANWHKKKYREFTYKSMLMLIHTTFERGMVNLYNLLVVERRVEDTVHKRNVVDIIKAFKHLDPTVASMVDPVRGFNFIRNKYAHSDGYYADPSTDIDAFKKIISNRNDITVKKVDDKKSKFNYRIEVTRSTVLTDYLDLIRKIFEALVTGGKKLPVLPQIASSNSSQLLY